MRSAFSPRETVLYSILGAATFALKMSMVLLPNIEPVSLLVILFAVCYGRRGIFSVYVYVFLEFAVWGLGLWSFGYLYVWGILFAAALLLRRSSSILLWASLSGCFGLLFGALFVPVYWIAGGWAAAVSWWVAGIPMDLLHGASNFVIALLLFKPMRWCFDALDRKYGISA